MSLLSRIVVILFALIVSSIAVGMAIAVGLLGPQWHAFSGDVGERVTFWSVAFFGSVLDRKSTRLNSSHPSISYAVFCLKKIKKDGDLVSDIPDVRALTLEEVASRVDVHACCPQLAGEMSCLHLHSPNIAWISSSGSVPF